MSGSKPKPAAKETLMCSDSAEISHTASVRVDPGICGFPCTIRARKSGPRAVTVEIIGSDCGQVVGLTKHLTEISLRELFLPMTRNPVYIAAEKAGCHPSCTIPAAVLKAVEVAMDMALPKEVRIEFKSAAFDEEHCQTD